MAVFEINMARDRVIPASRRKTWYTVLMLYLALTGVILALLAGAVTRHLVTAFDRCRDVSRLEGECLRSCPGQEDIAGYAGQVGARMARYADTLEAIAGVLSNRTHAATLLFGLAVPLPEAMALNNVDMNADKREIAFEVWVPESGAAIGMTPPSLIPLWTRHPMLAAQVTQIASVNSQRTKINGRGFSLWRFTGLLSKNGD